MPPATRFVRASGDCLRVERLRVDLRAVLFREEDFFAVDFRAEERLAVRLVLLRAPPFLAALRRLEDFFAARLVPPRLAADFRAPFFAVDFRAPFFAVDLRAPLRADFRAPPFFAADLRPDFLAVLRLLLDFLEERFFVAMPDLLQGSWSMSCSQQRFARARITVHDRGHVVRVREVLW